MKSMLSGFYNPKKEELNAAWLDEETLIVFDTNTLINLYGYAEKTREDFFLILENLSDKIWIPFHVALEYQRNRVAAIKEEKAVFKVIEDHLGKIEKVFTNDFQKLALERRFPKLHEKSLKLEKDVSRLLKNYRQTVSHWDKKQPCVRTQDRIREKLDHLFNGRVGNPPESQEVIDAISEEGLQRYENKTPPGYMDIKKDEDKKRLPTFTYGGIKYERKYGDLIIWNQIIDKANEKQIKNVIFVTDDAKEDWWYIISSGGEKTIGPRAELREEIQRDSEIDLFAMYNTSGFLEAGKQLLGLDIDETSISDASNSFLDQMLFRDFVMKEYRKKDDRLYHAPILLTDTDPSLEISAKNLESYYWNQGQKPHMYERVEFDAEKSAQEPGSQELASEWEKYRKIMEELLKRDRKEK